MRNGRAVSQRVKNSAGDNVTLRRKAKTKRLRQKRAIDEMPNYRFATEEDCDRLSLPPSFLGTFLNEDGTLPDFFSDGVTDKHHLPRKLRGKDCAEFAKRIVDQWLELPGEDRQYFARMFWRDLRLQGIEFPAPIADLCFFLLIGHSEIFQMVADYIEALKSDKRLAITTQKLVQYEFDRAASGRPPIDWRQMMDLLWPGWKGSSQNFQKFLRERDSEFRAVGKWRGNKQKCVQRRQKNTHRARCKLAATPFTAADVRQVQARARPRKRKPAKTPRRSAAALMDTCAGKRS